MGVTIRNYEPADLAACRELWVQMTEWHRTIYDSPGIGGDDPGRQFDDHLDKIGRERIWLAERDGVVEGMIGLQPGSEEGSLELEPMIVTPGARRTGVGRALVEHVIAVVKGLGLRDLNVRVVGRNAEAIRFYHDVGFNVIGYLELFHDTTPPEAQRWRGGEVIAGRTFRV